MISTSVHLAELRQRLLVSFGAIFFFAAISYFFAEHIARYFMLPLYTARPEVTLIYTNLTEAFITYLKLALLIGIIFSVPVLIYELWMFIAPGLHAGEKKTVLIVVFWASLLFTGGACFAFYIVLPKALAFFMGFANPELTPLPKLSSYLTFVARTSLAFGLAFEIPFLMVAAAKIGWVKRNYFTKNRKYAYPTIMVLAVLLTAGDLIAAILLCLPLFTLYESGILIISLFTKKQETDDHPIANDSL